MLTFKYSAWKPHVCMFIVIFVLNGLESVRNLFLSQIILNIYLKGYV